MPDRDATIEALKQELAEGYEKALREAAREARPPFEAYETLTMYVGDAEAANILTNIMRAVEGKVYREWIRHSEEQEKA